MPPRVSLVLLLLAGCGEVPRGVVGPGSRPLASTPPPEVAIVDEAFHVATPRDGLSPFVIGADDSIVVVASDDPSPDATASRVIALDEHLATRWELRQDAAVRGLLALGDQTLIATALASSNDTTLQLVDRAGKVTARATFQQLVGVPCAAGNRYWLAPEPGGFVALGGCGSPGQLQWVHVTDDLRSATLEPGTGWNPVYARAWMGSPMVSELSYSHLGEPHVLVSGLGRPGHHGAGAVTAAIGEGDLLVGAWTSNRQAGSGMFSNHLFVTRLGEHPWSIDLVPERSTGDPQHLAAVATAGDGTVLAAIDYGEEGRVTGARLPAPGLGAPALDAPLARALAIAELDGDRGGLRGVVVTRPLRPWHFSFVAQVGATARHLVVFDGQQIVVFPRHGRPTAPGADAPVIAAPTPQAVPAVAALSPLRERWAELCGPRSRSTKNQPCRLEHVAVGPDGSVAAAGSYYGTNQLASRPLRKQAFETGVLAVYAPGGALRWQKIFGASWHNDVKDVVIRDDGRVVITGIHGQHFALDGLRLPDRIVRKVSGQDMDFEAVSGFVAVFDATGKLELLEDLDVLASGVRSTATDASCGATLAASASADVTWVLARCASRLVRIPLRGATPERPVALELGGVDISSPWVVGPTGALFATYADLEVTRLVSSDGHELVKVPLLASRRFGSTVIPARGGSVWTATTGVTMAADDPDELVVGHVDPTLAHARTWRLESAPGAKLDGFTLDDQGRAIVAVQTTGDVTIGGQVIAPLVLDATSPRQGRVFVRLTADGSQIDRVFVPALAPTECTRPSHGQITSMAAHGSTLAVTFSFGVDAHCGVHDEPSTLMVFDAP